MILHLQLNAIRVASEQNGISTELTHIKLVDENGKYIKFIRHSQELLDAIRDSVLAIEVEDDFVV